MDMAYIAGIIDGEGHIGFSKTRNVIYPRLIVTNTDYEFINQLKDELGGYIRTQVHENSKWKIVYHWYLGNRKCVNLIEDIYEYLIIKSNQAWLIMAWDYFRPQGELSDESVVKLLCDQMSWLNKRGVNKNEYSPMAYVEKPELYWPI